MVFAEKTLNPSSSAPNIVKGKAQLRHQGVEHVELSAKTTQLLLLPSQFSTKIGHLLLFEPLLMGIDTIN